MADGEVIIKRQDGNLMNVGNLKMKDAVSIVFAQLQDIHSHLSAFFSEYKAACVDRDVPRDDRVKRIYQLTRAVESQIEEALIKMYERSLSSFSELIKYLTLGMGFERSFSQKLQPPFDTCDIFDLYLSYSMFILRHKAMDEYGRVPDGQREVIHPNLLPCKRSSDLMRRASYVSHSVIHLSRLVKNSRLE